VWSECRRGGVAVPVPVTHLQRRDAFRTFKLFAGVRFRRLADAEMIVRPFMSGVGSSGAMHFRLRPEFKKDEIAST
jgi:hypothetical protein